MDVGITWEYGNRNEFLGDLTEPSGVTSSSLGPKGTGRWCQDASWFGASARSGAAMAVTAQEVILWPVAEAVLLELLPLQTALARMHGFVMLFLLVAPMALGVFGDLLLHAAPCPRLIGVHLRAPVGRGRCLDAAHGWYPPGATCSALAPGWH